jgi:hypothetical protein
MKRGLFTLLVLAAIGILLIPASAGAAFSEFTTNFSFEDGPSHNVTINKFNTALGTLTGVTLYTNVNLTGQVQLINFTSINQSFTNARSTGAFLFTGPGGNVIGTATSDTGLINGSAAPPPFTVSKFNGSMTPYSWTTSIGSGSFGLYQGGVGDLATFVAAAGPYQSSASFSPGTLGVGGNSLIDGTITIHYDYTAVPIPGAVWLLGSGLIGIVGLRRRFKK